MENIEPALLWIAGICTAIVTIWTFAGKIGAAVKKPTQDLAKNIKELDDRLTVIEKTAAKNVARLTDGDHSFEVQAEMNKHLLHSMSLLLKHCADGNHTGQLQRQAEVLDQFIIDKAGKL